MPKTKTTKKTQYRTVQIPEDLIDLILALIPGLYRTHHEAIIEWIRLSVFELVKTKYKMRKLLRGKNLLSTPTLKM